MKRAIILVIDGFGIGSAPDAARFDDAGANTFGHIAETYLAANGRPLSLPHLAGMGLAACCEAVSNATLSLANKAARGGAYAAAAEISSGKDTPSGHWEMAGVPVLFDWGYFPHVERCFPQTFIDELVRVTGTPGVLGECHASGTDIIRELGEEHVQSGKPICYTSADSVFQVAGHEDHFGLDRLYEFCEAARELLFKDNIGRVIARPFVGSDSASFTRTGNRRDYSIEPPDKTVLDLMTEAGLKVHGIGKISDIFAHRGISHSTKATGLPALIDETLRQINEEKEAALIFTNLVNFDQDFGHRRDPLGYADALIYLDSRLPEIQAAMSPDDVLFMTSDHGCDPTWRGTDHTREYVPLLAWREGLPATDLGRRSSFADLGQTLATAFELPALKHGDSFLSSLRNAS